MTRKPLFSPWLYNYVVEPALAEKSGFIVSGQDFLWTERGLIRVAELCPDDSIVGIDREGKTSWSSIVILDLEKKSTIIRITTDSNECLLAPDCEVFTVEGIKKVADLSVGDVVETANIPIEILQKLDSNTLQVFEFADHEIAIDERLGYILGTQIRSKRYPDKVVFDHLLLDGEKYYMLASICNDIRKTSGIGGKISYVYARRRIRFDSRLLAQLCEAIWKTKGIAIELRKSPPKVMHAFVVGILDTILQRNKIETPPTFFSTIEYQGELRRFILNVLRLYRVIPFRMHCVPQGDGSISFRCSINTSDLSKLGLKFITMEIPPTPPEGRSISFSVVRNMSRLRGTTIYLSVPEPHWSPIVDLTPLHRHAFEKC
jgi:hypothetical protein